MKSAANTEIFFIVISSWIGPGAIRSLCKFKTVHQLLPNVSGTSASSYPSGMRESVKPDNFCNLLQSLALSIPF
jgi:hypothetical protein